jgi:hAT family C-terminal dimerisation region
MSRSFFVFMFLFIRLLKFVTICWWGRYGIAQSDVTCIVTDNASNMKSMGNILPFPWHGCFAHLLELVAKHWAPRHSDFGDIIQACRDVVSHYRSSSRATENLKQLCILCKVEYRVLQLDVSTRWWSTHSMIESIMHLQMPLRAVMSISDELGNDHNLSVKFEDGWWVVLERAAIILSPLMKAVKVLEGENYVTASWVPWILGEIQHELRIEMELAAGDSTLSECIARVYIDFKKRFCERDNIQVPSLIKYAALLDPRTKNWDYMSVSEEEALWDDLNANLVAQFVRERQEAQGNGGNVAVAVATPSVASSASRRNGDVFRTTRNTRTHFSFVDTYTADEEHHVDMVRVKITNRSFYNLYFCRCFDSFLKNGYCVRTKRCVLLHVLQVKAEIANYRKRPALVHTADAPANPLEWWAMKASAFPILSKMAKQMLAIPATSASSERVFSQAGQITRASRNRMDVSNTAQLIFLKGSWRKVKEMVGSQEGLTEDERLEDRSPKRSRAFTF